MNQDTLRELRRRVDSLEREDAARVLRDYNAVGEAGEAASPTEVKWGEVVSSTAANDTGCAFAPGEVVARELVAPPLWAAGEHQEGDVVVIPTAAEFDGTESYEALDLVVYEEVLYQAEDAVTPGGFDAEEWVAVGTPGDKLCAQATIPAGLFDPADWATTTAGLTLSATETTLDHHRPTAATAGSRVAWIGDQVVEFTDQAGGGSGAACGSIEISNLGGVAVRFVGEDCTSPWHKLPVLFCNDVAVTPAVEEPT